MSLTGERRSHFITSGAIPMLQQLPGASVRDLSLSLERDTGTNTRRVCTTITGREAGSVPVAMRLIQNLPACLPLSAL